MTTPAAHSRDLAHSLCAVPQARIVDCPVCPRTGLTSGTRHCPNCGVDLRPLWMLRSLRSRYCEEAAEAWRRSDLDRALSMLLCALELGEGEPEEILVLIARLCWQRGDRRSVLEYCERVLARNPEHADCQELVRLARRRPTGRLAVLALALALAACAAGAGLLSGERSEWGSTHSVTALAPAVSDAETSAWVAFARAPQVAVLAPSAVLDPLAERLRKGTRVSAVRSGGELRVEFPEGIFGGASAVPTPDGAVVLRQVAALLDEAETPLLIGVAGATDDLQTASRGRWGTNSQLAAARARGAVGVMLEVLRADGGMALRPAVLETPPFASDTAEGRARNRTVVLQISPRL
jgi:flagellar motor protein MotB